MLRFVAYNCCGAVRAFRLLQIVVETNADVLFFSGLIIKSRMGRSFESFTMRGDGRSFDGAVGVWAESVVFEQVGGCSDHLGGEVLGNRRA